MTREMRIFFLLLFLFCKVLGAGTIRPPHIDGEDELTVKKDESLTLRCQGSRPLLWNHSIPDLDENITTTTQTNADFPFVSILHVQKIQPSAYGYYYCHYSNATDFKNNKENVDSVYVFVSGKHIFAYEHLPPVSKVVSETVLIDCIPTHPNISVILKKDGTVINDSRISFDPKEGFSISNATLDDHGSYSCEANGTTIRTRVNIKSKETLPSPRITVGAHQHFVKGDAFSLDCSVISHRNITFSWRYPNTEAEYAKNESNGHTSSQKSTLWVPKASEADTGHYTCVIESEGTFANRDSRHIEIKENQISYVNITSNKLIVSREGDSLRWKATIQSYPPPSKIIYTNWKGEKLEETDRILMWRDEHAQSWLEINNVTSSDFGKYTITVITAKHAAKNSFTALLAVTSDPYVEMKGVPEFVVKGKSLNITCSVQGFPRANVSMMFQNCSTSLNSSCSSISPIQDVKNETRLPAPGNIVEKSILFTPNTSGLLYCRGKNYETRFQEETAKIIISDIGGIFVLRHSEQENITEVEDHGNSITVVENDHFSLMCGACKFVYERTLIKSDSPVQFKENHSEFSWQFKTTQKATKALTANYSCIAYPHNGTQPDIKNIIITVADEEQVQFEKDTNMENKTVEVEEGEPFSLNCSVTGSPTPTIYWTKDGQNLTTKSESFDKKAMHFSNDFKTLKLKYVIKKYMGKYSCSAENRKNKITGFLILKMSAPGMSPSFKLSLAVALVGITVLVIVIVFLVNRVKKERGKRHSFKVLTRDLFVKGNIDSLNPECTADQQADMLPYDKKKWEVPRGNITLGKQLGSGAFGRVIKATVIGLEGPATTTVAIKMCKNDVTSQMHVLISELKIMMHLGKHLNIVNLMGASTVEISKGELWILVEYCRFGNLLDFLQRHRRKFVNQICPVTGKINQHMVPHSPVSVALSESYSPTPAVDQDGYLAPSSSEFIHSDSPLGNSAGTVPSTSKSSISYGPAGPFASNPMYSMNIGSVAEDEKKEPGGRGFRIMSVGSITSSDSNSVSHPLKSTYNNMTSFTQHYSSRSPSSPTDTFFSGDIDSDLVLEIGSVPGVTATFSTSDLICWGWQVAQGMSYLSRRKILHGDLAARNLLLADKNVVKISDFGLSRNMYRNDNYKKTTDDMLPVKWMSIEAIRDRLFSIESDVWAFGITLWEIFSLGRTPYAGIEVTSDFLEQLENGYRMNCPKYANQEIHNIMNQCWDEHPLDRPSFSQLVDYLGHMIPDLKEEYLSQNETYMQMNTERFREETDYLSMMASPAFENKTMPNETGVDYVNVPDQSKHSSCIGVKFADAVAVSLASSPPLSPVECNYLPMGSMTAEKPDDDVFSPHPNELSRFTFASSDPESSKLTPPEEKPSENSTMMEQSLVEGSLSEQSRN